MNSIVRTGELTGSQIEAKFRVCPESGDVERLGRNHEWKRTGWIKPGNPSNGGGYRMSSLRVNKKNFGIRLHRLVWMWVNGEWPEGEIDHINGDRSDNRISNLRLATVSQNRTNKAIQADNQSGYKWVYKYGKNGLYRADVTYYENGIRKRFRTCSHKTPDAAYEAASNFAKSVHGEFYNPGKK